MGVVDAHRTSQHDQAVIAVQARLGIGVAREIHITNAKTGALQQRIQCAEKLMRDVLEDKKLFHRGSIGSIIRVGWDYNVSAKIFKMRRGELIRTAKKRDRHEEP